jgi:hypothetical protein
MKYISKYSNGKEITPAQYITELICEHWAKQNKKDLHYRFWATSPEWAKHYKGQIPSANKLLKKYSAAAIIKALNDPQTQKTYSLRSPILPAIIEKHQRILDSQTKELTKIFERKEDIKYSQSQSKKNIISKLKDLDNE